MRKINFLIWYPFVLYLTACQSALKTALTGKKGENTGDEFLVAKKKSFSFAPPDYGRIAKTRRSF